MAVIRNNLPEHIEISFQYSCAIELFSSLHVITDPMHHTNCINWYDNCVRSLDKKLLHSIVDFGRKFAEWTLVMDIVDNFSKIPSPDKIFEDDFYLVIERFKNLPREEFAYIFLGETILGNREIIYDLIRFPEHLSNYNLDNVYHYVKKENVEYFIHHIDETLNEIINLATQYYESFFKEHWQKTCAFYRGALLQEKKEYNASSPINFILSLHDDLKYENETLIIKKHLDFYAPYQEIRKIKIILSAFTYPHLMFNVYNTHLSIYRNMLMPNMSVTFDDLSSRLKVFSDSTRLTIIKLLLNGALTNKSLASLLNITPASVSQHLKILKEAKMLYSERDKNNIYYRINKTQIIEVLNELDYLLEIKSPPDM